MSCVVVDDPSRSSNGQDKSMKKAGGRSFPAVIIYNVDGDGGAGLDTNQPVVFQREESKLDREDESLRFDVHLDSDGATFSGD
jgi:hypothetical protein